MSHLVEIPVRFGEVDSAGVVYYPNLLHYCHVAMEEAFGRAVGVRYPDLLGRERLGFPAVRVESDFLAPVAYGETLRVEVSVEEVGRASVRFLFAASRSSDGRPAFRARITTVCVDLDAWATREVPARHREALARLAPAGEGGAK